MKLSLVIVSYTGPFPPVRPLNNGEVYLTPDVLAAEEVKGAPPRMTRLVFREQGVQIVTRTRSRARRDTWREQKLEVQSVTHSA